MKYLICFLVPVFCVRTGFSENLPPNTTIHFFSPGQTKIVQVAGFLDKCLNNIIAEEDTASPVDTKVIISAGVNNLEFTPLSSFNNGLLIQPVNRVTQAAMPTAFFSGDTSSWSFYTNSIKRLSIYGSGYISTSTPLLIKNATKDGISALRVNGQARFDSAISIRAQSDSTGGYISIHRNMKSVYQGEDDGISPYTTTPTTWAVNKNIPVFRLRHPNNVTGNVSANSSVQRDFLIVPYQYGTAIEYNGVVECWVGEWSIHKGLYYQDVERKGNGWGAVLWVGDDQDLGGIRATARNNSSSGGNVNYGELSVERFAGTADGDFRFRLPSTSNQFHFVYGERGSTNIVAKVSDKGFFLPVVSSVAAITIPEKGQLYFDNAASQFKGYDGVQWKDLANDLITGKAVSSSNGTDKIYKIAHGLSGTPSYFNVLATSSAAASIRYVTADAAYIYIYYTTAPSFGINNLSWNWQVKR